MKSTLELLSAGVLASLATIAIPTTLFAQTYICTTTTRTTTSYHTDESGTIYITTISVTSRVCVPMAAE